MKSLVIGILLLTASHHLVAQTSSGGPYPVRPRFNIDFEIAVPGGEFGHQFGVGFGGSGGLDIPVTRSFYATGSAGVMSLYQGNKNIPTDTRTFIPMKVGGKVYFNPIFYAQMELGTAVGVQQGAGTAFIMTPGVGMSYHITEKAAINAGVRFENWSREQRGINLLTFKVGYQF